MITKKKIGEFMTDVKVYKNIRGWRFFEAGAYMVNGKTNLYAAYHGESRQDRNIYAIDHGEGLDATGHAGRFEKHVDITAEMKTWLAGLNVKKEVINKIQAKIHIMEGEA